MTRPSTPLYLHGETGCGKTFAAALMHTFYPLESFWVNSVETCRLIGECRRSSGDEVRGRTFHTRDGVLREFWEVSFWNRIQTVPLVVIDEIGSKSGGIGNEVLYSILNERGNKFTILTGNLSPADMRSAGFDSRLISRLTAGVVCFAGSEDRR